MTQIKTNPKVDAFFREVEPWRDEMKALRKIILGCGLTEELKWAKPCYSFQGHNVVILQGFKDFCALLFCKGALLKDPKGLLQKPGENTQAARRIPFTSVREIAAMQSALKSFIREAIQAEKAGLEVTYKKPGDLVLVGELQNKLEANPALKKAFGALTPGRQRAYHLYFSAAKQSATRESRIEKCVPQILKGRGLNDDYKDRARG